MKLSLKASNPFEELDKSQFDISALDKEINDYLGSFSNESFVVYACDARSLLLFVERNKFIYKPYMDATKILPDGRPIYWLTKKIIAKNQEHLTGPVFMMKVLADAHLKGKRHMFYGGSADSMDRLKLRCLDDEVNLVYAESPPFLDLNELDVAGVNHKINYYDIDFFWCGLGAPKQEYLINQLDRNCRVVMTGVGLAFDYYAGTVKKPPKIIAALGFEWLVRYVQQPKRIGRFIRPFFYVLKLLISNILFKDKFS
jgi:N-acetylglucosaminyldiphosphoundecaprenol N-acetyl-beta-D-mannosaminyltransferase